MIDEVPPHDSLIERRVLAAMMADELAARVGRDALSEDDFYMPKFRAVFLTLCNRIDAGESLDPALLSHAGIDRDVLGDILDSSWMVTHIESYVSKLRDLSAARKAQQGIASVMSLTASPGVIAEQLRNVADSVESKSPEIAPDTVSTMYREIDEEVAGRRFAVPLPWPMITDEVIPLTPNSITILCGGPGATKSLMAIQAFMFILANSTKAALLELEKGASYHLRRCAAQITGNSDITRASWCKANPSAVELIKSKIKDRLDALRLSILAPAASNGCTASELVSWVQSKARDHRVIGIDPITMMTKNAKSSWADDEYFMKAARRVIEKNGNSLFIVTHPRKAPPGSNRMHSSMDDLAGGIAYSRFSDNIMFLVAHDEKSDTIDSGQGRKDESYNRTLIIFKARDGSATGRRFAMRFDQRTLTLSEVGRIVKE